MIVCFDFVCSNIAASFVHLSHKDFGTWLALFRLLFVGTHSLLCANKLSVDVILGHHCNDVGRKWSMCPPTVWKPLLLSPVFLLDLLMPEAEGKTLVRTYEIHFQQTYGILLRGFAMNGKHTGKRIDKHSTLQYNNTIIGLWEDTRKKSHAL